MNKTDTLTSSNSKSSLQDLLTRTRSTSEPRTAPRRRAEDRAFAPGEVQSVVFEPVLRKPYDLAYACLIIPRFSAHYLIGDIAESLREWMQQTCISYAWRLDTINIRPEYMQWVLYVPPATPPSKCIRTVRQQTSVRIFEDFPHIRKENISDDFWAPGYLVLVGPTPHPSEMISEYIRLTRQQQGIQPHFGA